MHKNKLQAKPVCRCRSARVYVGFSLLVLSQKGNTGNAAVSRRSSVGVRLVVKQATWECTLVLHCCRTVQRHEIVPSLGKNGEAD